MEMSQIRYALAAARTLNFTKAAADCNVSQPALTKAIKTLEGELGAPLFHREGRSVKVSDFGRSMFPHLKNIIEEAETTQTLARNFRLLNQAPVRIGVLSTIGHVRLARFLSRFEAEYEGVEIAVTEDGLRELEDKLDDGELDVAVLNPADGLREGFHEKVLYRERYVVVFPPDHDLGRHNAIRLKDLSGQRYVDRLSCELRETVMSVCEESGVELYAKFRSEREDWVQAMVLARIGFAFMPEYSVTLPGLIQRPLIEPEVDRPVSLITVPGRPFSPAISAFVRAAQAFAWPG